MSKLTKYIYILFFLLLSSIQVNATEGDWLAIRKIGKVKTTIKMMSKQHEECQKAIIICELADSLLFDLNFNHDIRINFEHLYFLKEKNYIFFNRSEPGYALYLKSYDKGPMEICLSIRSYEFDVEKALKLLDYAVKNYKRLRKEYPEKEYKYNCKEFNFDFFEYNKGEGSTIERLYYSESLISNTEVQTALQQPASKDVKKVMEKKIYRPLEKGEVNPTEGISYYMQNGKYYIFHRIYDYTYKKSKDTIVLVINSIFQFESKKSNPRAIVFDSYCSFYFIDKFNNSFLSKRQVIPDLKTFYWPFEVQFSGSSIIHITKPQQMVLYSDRNIIYRIKDNLLIPDLDAVLDKYKLESSE